MFPGARFVHIHRHPIDVFQSFRHYFDTAGWHTYMQKPDVDAIDTRIINRYTTMPGERDVTALAGYRKNVFSPLEPDLRERVGRAWSRSFAEWGYGALGESTDV